MFAGGYRIAADASRHRMSLQTIASTLRIIDRHQNVVSVTLAEGNIHMYISSLSLSIYICIETQLRCVTPTSRRLDNAIPSTRTTLLKELSDAYLALEDELHAAVSAVSQDTTPQADSISSPSSGL